MIKLIVRSTTKW